MKPFTHLHLHTEYSLLDGFTRIDKLMDTVKSLGMDSVAITDHGVMFGAIHFYNAAIKAGVKPIIGCEMYVATNTRFDKRANIDSDKGHLVLLAKNMEGYKNLMKLVSISYTEGFYYKPRIDMDLLKKHSGGLICLSACLSGQIPSAILKNEHNRAVDIAMSLKNMFDENCFYLELQDNNLEDQRIVNQELIQMSKDLNIPLVATNDVHYLNKDDAKAHDVLLCIQTGKTIDEENRMKFPSNDFYLKSPDVMYDIFSYIPEACENTKKIADMCNLSFDFTQIHLPEFAIKDHDDHFEYLKDLVYKGLINRYGENPDKIYIDRMNYELDTINSMGYVDYFLITSDFINFARSKGIYVGPGRGSAAGSIVSYALKITSIDPIKYDLLFERFLNPERVTMPDIDIDFCYERRPEVIQYVIDKYGMDKVCQIITFGTLKARAAIRDVGRVLGIPYNEVDSVAKMIPRTLGITLDEAIKVNKELASIYNLDPKIKELLDLSKRLEGVPRHSSTHAAGVVITKESVNNYVPLALNDESVVTQYPMENLEQLGILKMDFLGLRTLTVIGDAIELIKKTKNIDIDIEKITYDDDKVYKTISSGDTIGIFQLESGGMTNFMKELQPTSLEDIIAGISLYRPGPMEQIPRYIANKKNRANIKYHTELLKPILDVTYGCMVYQEQVIRIVRDIADYTMGHADIVRRAMAKKKHKVMVKEREIFIKGAVNKGVALDSANAIYDEMMDFASYAFNKSHAAAYAVIGYQTAYLKTYHRQEFMAATLNSFIDSTDKIVLYIRDCEKHHISINAPSINMSISKFSVNKNDIIYGFAGIKGVGKKAANCIVKERTLNGPYEGFNDFSKRISLYDVNKKCVESLIKAGCFDNFNENRRQLMSSFEKILESINNDKKRNIEGQISLFNMLDIKQPEFIYPDLEEFDYQSLLGFEKEMLGIYVSGNPLRDYMDIIDRKTTFNSSESVLNEDYNAKKYYDGRTVCVAGMIRGISKKITKKNNMMAFITLEDNYGTMEIVAFPNTYEKYRNLIVEDYKVIIKGKLSLNDDNISILSNSIDILSNESINKEIIEGIYFNCINIDESRVYKAIEYFKGDTPVYIRYEENGNKLLKKTNNSLYISSKNDIIAELIETFGNKNIYVKRK